jgi:hypothetical protein
MMGREEAEQFLSSRLSHAKIYEQNKGGVRYLSNVPESLKGLKSFKEKGRWELMPKDEEHEDDYYDSDDVYDEMLDSPKGNNIEKLVKNKSSDSSSDGGGQGYQGGISLTNHNRYYKKDT